MEKGTQKSIQFREPLYIRQIERPRSPQKSITRSIRYNKQQKNTEILNQHDHPNSSIPKPAPFPIRYLYIFNSYISHILDPVNHITLISSQTYKKLTDNIIPDTATLRRNSNTEDILAPTDERAKKKGRMVVVTHITREGWRAHRLELEGRYTRLCWKNTCKSETAFVHPTYERE